MVRALIAVLFGYVAMAAWIFISLAFLSGALGRDFTMNEATGQASAGWLAISLPVSFVGAMIGGFLAALLARERPMMATRVLAGLVLVFGAVIAVQTLLKGGTPPGAPTETIVGHAPPPTASPGDDSLAASSEADAAEMVPIEQPLWFTLVIPLLGATGVLAGGALGVRRQRARAG